MLKKTFITFLSIILIISILGGINVNATELKTTLDIINKASETKYLESNQGYISKTIIDSNSDTGEVTIELKLSNTTKFDNKNADELFIVIDDSSSMLYGIEGYKNRKEALIESSKKLVNSIYEKNKNINIGIVQFGYNAEIKLALTNKKDEIINKLDELKKCEDQNTNIDAGIYLAHQSFSKNAGKKIILLLTDGIPTQDREGNIDYWSIKSEKRLKIANNAANSIKNAKNSNIDIIALMTGLVGQEKENSQNLLDIVFGTKENRNVSEYYEINDSDIDKIMSSYIFSDIMERVYTPINNVKIVDYFPDDIKDNFEFSYVGKPNVGKVANAIDKTNNTITWDIGTLKGNETATLKYKLKIKDIKNKDLLNKVIATNEKVVLTYKDNNSKDYTVTLTSSPKIKLSEVKEKLNATVSYNPTANTTGRVTATIKTNKKINEVDGWTLSKDEMTLTKVYSANATETVHLVDSDKMTKDVEIKVNNIKSATNLGDKKDTPTKKTDETKAKDLLPNTGVEITITAFVIITAIIAIVTCKKYNSYKGIK